MKNNKFLFYFFIVYFPYNTLTEEKIMGKRADKAYKLFMEGFTCSQSVFAAFSDLFGIDEKTALRASAGLGGGVGRMREICGVVTSASLVLGLMYGATEGEDSQSKAYTYEKVREFSARMKEKVNG